MNEDQQETDDMQNMSDLLDSVEPMKSLRRGDIVAGVVMRADSEGILVNIGHKAEGHVPPGEMKTVSRQGAGPVKVGDEVIASVVKGESEDGNIVLSIDRAVGEKGWHSLEKAMETGAKVEGSILGFNRGGAIVEVEGVRCFVPLSQLVSVSRERFRQQTQPEETVAPAAEPVEESADTSEGADSVEGAGSADNAEGVDSAEGAESADSADSVEGADSAESAGSAEAEVKAVPEEPEEIGTILGLKVLEVNRGRNRAILSERQAIQEQREERKAKLIEELNEGEVRKGKVTGISSFGAFVDLGGADGLVHVSELSWTPVVSPDEVVKVGDEVDVFVLRVDAKSKKIALSMKRLQREPWETIEQRLAVGEVVDATVTKLTDFGAFARVEGSVEGLIHISEMASRVINHPRDVLREGDDVRVKVLRIEPERRRLGLSLRQAEEDEGM